LAVEQRKAATKRDRFVSKTSPAYWLACVQ